MMILQVMFLLVRAICEMREVLHSTGTRNWRSGAPNHAATASIQPNDTHSNCKHDISSPFSVLDRCIGKGVSILHAAWRLIPQACQEAMHLGLICSSTNRSFMGHKHQWEDLLQCFPQRETTWNNHHCSSSLCSWHHQHGHICQGHHAQVVSSQVLANT